MTDKYEKIRQALKMGPSKGPWEAELQTGAAHSAYGVTDGWKISGPDYIPDWEDTFFSKADAYYIATCDPATIRALLADYDRMREALEASIEQMERDADMIDGEWGECRSIDELERDGKLPEALVLARAALAQEQGGNNE